MEKRALIAFVLSMAIFVVWAYFFSPSQPPSGPPSEETPAAAPEHPEQDRAVPLNQETQEAVSAPSESPAEKTTAPPAQTRDITVRTKLYTAVFTESGGRLKSLTLNQYRASIEPDSPPKELVTVKSPADWPLGLSFLREDGPDLSQALFKADQTKIDLTGASNQTSLVMTYTDPNGLQVVRTYTFRPDSYLIDMRLTLRNLSTATIDDNLVVELASEPFMQKQRYSFAGFGAMVDDELLEIKVKDLEEDLEKIKNRNYVLNWAVYEDQYFLAGLLPQDKEKTRVQAAPLGERGVRIKFINAPLVMPPKTEKEYNFTIFYGPKDYSLLKSLGNDLHRAIYFGWFDILSKPLLILITWLYKYVPNYGAVIIIVTILIKILFWPLTAKSYKSMKEMQKLQPKIMKLREKYKDDREAMNREMMQMYRTYKVNPMGGCLPMVIQIPVFIALYRLLDYALELRHAPFCLWINDLSAPDRLFHFPFQIPLMQEPAGIPVLTLLMGASMLIQQKMTPTPGDPAQAKIMMLMPIFFTFIFINFPAGLVLYWLVNNLLSIGQQYLINKRTT